MSKHEAHILELMQLPYHIDIHGTPEDGYLASVRELDGCFTAGDTAEEAHAMVKDALAAWLESILDSGLPVPPTRATTDVCSCECRSRFTAHLRSEPSSRASASISSY